MPKESNYFEEAYELCNDAMPLVANTAKALYQRMCVAHFGEGVSPAPGFNILFFFQSVIRHLQSARGDQESTSTSASWPLLPIRAMNLGNPTEQDNWGPYWKTYAEKIKHESVEYGDDFDVTYAVFIASSVIDGKGKLINEPPGSAELGDLEDDWLAGFNAVS